MRRQRQNGTVLIVSLLMLIVLTLLAVSAINTGTVNLRIAGNMQAQTRTELATQQAIEAFLGDIGHFTSPVAQSSTVSGVTVAVSQPVCRRTVPATGYSAAWSLVPEDNDWEFTAIGTEATSGARAEIVQGVRIRMTSGSCP